MNALEGKDQVTIFVKREGSEITEKYDRDDQCMKVAIASFEIISDNTQGSSDYFFCGNEPQIVLHLRDFAWTVKYVTEEGAEVHFEGDREADVVACAADSVLQALHKGQCVGKEEISYQSRRGGHFTKDLKISGISTIILNPNIQPSGSLNFKEGIISRTYAYLGERKLCLFLNKVPKNTLDKIDSILSGLFPRKSSHF